MTYYNQCPECGHLLAPTQAHSTETCLRNQKISNETNHRFEAWCEQFRGGFRKTKVSVPEPEARWSSSEAEQGNVSTTDVIITGTKSPKRKRRNDEIVDFGNIPVESDVDVEDMTTEDVVTRRCDCGHTLEQHHSESKACLEDCVCMEFGG